MKKGIIILSGGLDSTVLAHHLVKEKNYDLSAISFDYGQKHKKELVFAKEQAKMLNIPHQIISLDFINKIFKSDLLESGNKIPEGHYQDENMKQTVVPNRNMILISIAVGRAISQQRNSVFYGAHQGDHAIYPDCRSEFIQKMKAAIALCDWKKINLEAPFQNLDKTQIVRKGTALGVDFDLTWTCYKGLEKPCGKCGSCVERQEAFDNQ